MMETNSESKKISSSLTERDTLSIDEQQQTITFNDVEGEKNIRLDNIESIEYVPLHSLNLVSLLAQKSFRSYKVVFRLNEQTLYTLQNVPHKDLIAILPRLSDKGVQITKKAALWGRATVMGIPVADKQVGKWSYAVVAIAVALLLLLVYTSG